MKSSMKSEKRNTRRASRRNLRRTALVLLVLGLTLAIVFARQINDTFSLLLYILICITYLVLIIAILAFDFYLMKRERDHLSVKEERVDNIDAQR